MFLMGSNEQNMCESNMLDALKFFNNHISDGGKSTLKSKLQKLHEKLQPVEDNVDEDFKESYNSVVDLIDKCADKCSDKFNIKDQDPLSQIYKKIMGKKISDEFVDQKLWSIDISNISGNSVKFPADLASLKKELEKFLINLLKQIYPNTKTSPNSSVVQPNGQEKNVKLRPLLDMETGKEKFKSIFNDFYNIVNYIINQVINTNMGQVKIEDKTYSDMIEQCKDCIIKLRNKVNNCDGTASLTETELDSILAIQNCLNKFLKNPQIFDKEIDKTAPILVLFEKLTGSSATLKDITNSYGDPFNSIAIKNMKISEDKDFNKSFKNCLAALMRIYNAKNNVERFTHLIKKMSAKRLSTSNLYKLPNKGKEVIAKALKADSDPDNQKNDQKEVSREINANTKVYHKTLKLKEKEKEKQQEIGRLKQELDQTENQEHSRELEQKIEGLESDIKKLKSSRNRVANVKIRGNVIETKKAFGDLWTFLEYLPNFYSENPGKLTVQDQIDCVNGLVNDMVTGVKQFHETYKRVHYDVRPENFLIYHKKKGSLLEYKCKLADCDLSMKINDKFKYQFAYTSPYRPGLLNCETEDSTRVVNFCSEKAYGLPGASLAVAEDNYGLYKTMEEILENVNDRNLFSEIYDFIDDKMKKLKSENDNFTMFDNFENLKKFLVKKGAIWVRPREEKFKNFFNSFNRDINYLIDNAIDDSMDQVDSEDEIYFRMIEQCKICMTKFWYTMDKWDFTDLSEIEADSILGVQNCLVYFLRNPKTFDNKIDNSSPILVLFKELTGSSATLKDITNSYGDPSSSVAIKNMKISESKDFNRSFKNCLAALMRIYNAKNNIKRFANFVKKLGEGTFGIAESYKLPNKEVVAKTLKSGDGYEEVFDHELNANTEVYHKTLKLKKKEKEKRSEIERLKQELDKAQNQERIRELGQKIKDLESDRKESKLGRNRVIDVKMRGKTIETKKAFGDLWTFFENLPDIYKNNSYKLTITDKIDCIKGLVNDMVSGVKQFHNTYKRVHCDIKPENFLVYHKNKGSLLDYKCKLADCDLSAKINDKFEYKFLGTRRPELLNYKAIDGKKVINFCFDNAYGLPGANLRIAEDNYALYKSMKEIRDNLDKDDAYSETYDFIDDKMKKLKSENDDFAMFDNFENLKKFLIEKGATWIKLDNE